MPRWLVVLKKEVAELFRRPPRLDRLHSRATAHHAAAAHPRREDGEKPRPKMRRSQRRSTVGLVQIGAPSKMIRGRSAQENRRSRRNPPERGGVRFETGCRPSDGGERSIKDRSIKAALLDSRRRGFVSPRKLRPIPAHRFSKTTLPRTPRDGGELDGWRASLRLRGDRLVGVRLVQRRTEPAARAAVFTCPLQSRCGRRRGGDGDADDVSCPTSSRSTP